MHTSMDWSVEKHLLNSSIFTSRGSASDLDCDTNKRNDSGQDSYIQQTIESFSNTERPLFKLVRTKTN